MGIISICIDYGIVPAVIAIIFSIMAKKRIRQNDILGAKFTKAGFILGIIGCALWVINVIMSLLGVAALSTLFY